MAHYGIDISKYQHGAPIDWPTVYQDRKQLGGGGEPFCFFNYVEPQFVDDLKASRAAGFKAVATYDFYNPADNAVADEAHYRVATGNLPGALDLEETSGLSWAQVSAQGAGWLGQPAESGSLLYSNLNYLQNMPGAPWGHPIWFAGTANPPGGSIIWQYGTGPVPGIAGLVDLDRWVGSEAQFAKFFALDAPAPVSEEDMKFLVQEVGFATVWVADFIHMRPVANPQELATLQFLFKLGGWDQTIHQVPAGQLHVFGEYLNPVEPVPAAPAGAPPSYHATIDLVPKS